MSLNNITLYIKRAELNHDKNYIINACHQCRYGKVSDVKFIEKEDVQGRKYNGAIVIFEDWYNSSLSQQLFSDMAHSKDGSAKLFHDPIRMRFWHVIKFVPKITDDLPIVQEMKMMKLTDGLTEKEKYEEMEKKYNSMAAQMHFMQAQMEKMERLMMEQERQYTQAWIENEELKDQLFQKDVDLAYELRKKDEEVEEILRQQSLEIMHIEGKYHKILLEQGDKNYQIEKLDQEVRDAHHIMDYLENEAIKMRYMINESFALKKPVVEEIV